MQDYKCIQKKRHITRTFIHFFKQKKDEPLENSTFPGIHTSPFTSAEGGIRTHEFPLKAPYFTGFKGYKKTDAFKMHSKLY